MKIVFAGGGTAGHVHPIIAIIREIKTLYPKGDIGFYYIGPRDDFAASLLVAEGVAVRRIMAGKLRRYLSFQNIIDIFFKFPIGFLQAFFHVFVISPDLVFSKGGYGSMPTVLASKILSAPIFLHESDIIAGFANKMAGKFALEIFTAFPVEKMTGFPKDKMMWVGNPIRKEIAILPEKANVLNLKGGRPILFFMGGSQGAQIINERLISILPDILEKFEVIHQVGQNNFDRCKKEAQFLLENNDNKDYYHPYAFLNEEELAFAYNVSALIIGRGGAGSIFEISALGKPSIIVPLKNSAQNHQLRNAYTYADTGASIVLEEANFTPRFLAERINFLFNNPQKMKVMAEKAKAFSKPDAGRIVAEYILAYLTQ